MEVVGVAASFIAIGQALAALPTLVGIIQSVVKVREELSDLLFEVCTHFNFASKNPFQKCRSLMV